MTERPPKILIKILGWFCHPDLLASIEGDLHEFYHEIYRAEGKRKANWFLFKEVFLLLRRSLIRPFGGYKKLNSFGMFKNHIQVAFRHLFKHKKYALINILGLTVGIASSFLLLKYVQFFASADQEHLQSTQIFQVAQAETSLQSTAPFKERTFFGLGPYAKANYPEVTMASRYITTIESRVIYRAPDGNVFKYNEPNISEADPDFLRMFSFKFILGDAQHALDEPNSVVLTESTAIKYFGDENPMGKMLETTSPWGSQYQLIVKGVIKDLPINSSLGFDFLKSLFQKPNEPEDDWGIPAFNTFLFLNNSGNSAALSASLGEDLSNMEVLSDKGKFEVQLTSLSATKLSLTQQLVLLTAVLILVICWTNFANLFTARSLGRAREMAMRKVNGASAMDTFYQLATESLLIHLIALAGALGLTIALYPYFQSITQGELLPYSQGSTSLIFFIAFVLAGALITSIYPTLIINKNSSAQVLKNASRQSTRYGLKLPIIIQFVLSAVLIISAGIISKQLNYLQDKTLGYKTDNTLIISPSKDLWNDKFKRFQAFQQQVKALAEVDYVASVTSIPGRGGNGDFMTQILGKPEQYEVIILGVGVAFVEAMDLPIVAGQSYQQGRFQKNRRSVIINEAAVEALGFQTAEEAIGQKIKNRSDKPNDYREIQGVVKDFHLSSLKNEIKPLLINYNPFRGHVLVSLNTATYTHYDQLRASLDRIEGVWNDVYTDQVFDVQFMDSEFERQYRSEISLRKMFTIFTFVSVFLSCLGLIGLAMFTALQRKSEVGVRKVLGATVWSILRLFSRDFLRQIIIAIVLAIPLAYYLMETWLQGYSYRTSMTPLAFLLPGMILLSLGLVTIILQTLKSARSNPAQVLRNE